MFGTYLTNALRISSVISLTYLKACARLGWSSRLKILSSPIAASMCFLCSGSASSLASSALSLAKDALRSLKCFKCKHLLLGVYNAVPHQRLPRRNDTRPKNPTHCAAYLKPTRHTPDLTTYVNHTHAPIRIGGICPPGRVTSDPISIRPFLRPNSYCITGNPVTATKEINSQRSRKPWYPRPKFKVPE